LKSDFSSAPPIIGKLKIPSRRSSASCPNLKDFFKPGIFIAQATYNGERHLQEQLASFVRQMRLLDELVVGDDGSKDRTFDILRKSRAPHPSSSPYYRPARGVASPAIFRAPPESASTNSSSFPIRITSGCQQSWRRRNPRCLKADPCFASMLDIGRYRPEAITLYRQGGHQRGISGTRTFEPLAFNPDTGCGNSMMFHRDLLYVVPDDIRLMQPHKNRRLAHDTWIYALAAALVRITHIGEPLMLWRLHGRNTFGARKYSAGEKLGKMNTVPIDDYRLYEKFYDEIADALAGAHTHLDSTLTARVLAARQNIKCGATISCREPIFIFCPWRPRASAPSPGPI
jgi:glycosyltransferase involved in cell wall biosynthesis